MSYPQPTTRPGKLLTPAMLVALGALLVLAVVTVIVVLQSNDEGPGASGSTSTATTSSTVSAATDGSATTSSSAPKGDLTASDDSFSYAMPAGYEDAMGKVPGADGVVMVYDPDTDIALPTTIIVSTEPAYGATLDQAVASTRGHVENALTASTKATSTSVSKVDGEPAKAIISEDYDLNGKQARTLMILTIHDDTLYGFVLNVATDNLSAGTATLEELASSVTWNG